MKHIYKYNHLFFTEESKNSNNQNIEFWNRLSDFDIKYPQAELQVIHYIKEELFIGKYVECLEFQCHQESETQQVQTIYNNHYHIQPLTFQPFLEQEPTFEELKHHEDKNK